MKLLTIIDYKIGNQKSLEIFFKNLGYETSLTYKKNEIDKSEIIVLPGIGAFPSAIKSLNENNLIDVIRKKANKGTPIIGICLGMQLLASKSYEFEETKGLNLIPGQIKKLKHPKSPKFPAFTPSNSVSTACAQSSITFKLYFFAIVKILFISHGLPAK